MKHFMLLVLLTTFGSVASLWWTPYAGVALYYFYAILRPQFLWEWSLNQVNVVIPWSFILAACAISGYLLWSAGLLAYGRREATLMRYRPKFTIAHWMMMLFAFWITMSQLLANDPHRGDLWFGEYLKIFGMYFLASRVVRTPTQIWGLFMLIFIAIGYISIEMNHIYISTGKLVLYRRGFAGLDNNGAALMLCLGVPLAYFAWEFTEQWYRWTFLLIIPVIIHAVLGTYSRGAMIAMLGATPFLFLFSRKRKTLLCIFAVVAALMPFMAGKEIQDRFFSIEKREMDDSFNSRQISWAIAMDIATENPIFGVGIRNSGAEMKNRGADMENRTIHSQYLQVAADSGWCALAVFLGMVLATFWCIFRASVRLWHRTDFESRRAKSMLGGITCSLISYLIGALALSLEVFEIAYLLLFLGAQVWALLNATDTLKQDPYAGSVKESIPQLFKQRIPVPVTTRTPRTAPPPQRQSAPPQRPMPNQVPPQRPHARPGPPPYSRPTGS
jgi:probable O-glycosylation ligase (exosortase A-associated)